MPLSNASLMKHAGTREDRLYGSECALLRGNGGVLTVCGVQLTPFLVFLHIVKMETFKLRAQMNKFER